MTDADNNTTPQNLAQDMFNMWKNSPGHNAGMLDDWMYSMGFGYKAVKVTNGFATVFATQEFSGEGAPKATNIK